MNKIYVNIKRYRKETPEDFFDRIHYGDYTTLSTYYDKDCIVMQCSAGSRRSFSDLYKIMRTYYSKITHKQLISIIYKKCLRNKYFHLIYCPDVKKIVLYHGVWNNVKSKLFTATYVDYDRYLLQNKIKEIDKFTIYYLYGKLGYTKKEIKEQIKKLK